MTSRIEPREISPRITFRAEICLAVIALFWVGMGAPVHAADRGSDPDRADSTHRSLAANAAGSSRHNVLAWPIYVDWRSDEGASLQMYGPASVLWKSRDERSGYLLYPTTGVRHRASGRSEYRVLWPLTDLVRDRRAGYLGVHVAGPLLGYERRSNADGRATRIAPVFMNRTSTRGIREFEVAPFFHHSLDSLRNANETEYGFMPLLGGQGVALARSWAERDERGWNAALILGGKSSPAMRALWLPPYFSYDRLTGPESPTRVRALLPFYASWLSPTTRGWDIGLAYTGGHTASLDWLWLPPYFSQTRRGGMDGGATYRALIPVFGQWSSSRREVAFVLPSLWRYRSASMAASGVWPAYAVFHSARRDSTHRSGGSVAWPLVSWGHGDRYSAVGVLPFYYRLQDGDSKLTVAPPIYGRFERPGLDVRALLPVYLLKRTPTDTLEAITLYYRRNTPGRATRGFFPLYEGVRTVDMHREYLAPFYYHRRDARGEQRLIFPAWADWRNTANGTRTRMYGPVVLTNGRASRGFGVVPVFYTGSGPAGSASLLGPLFWSRGKDGSRHAVAFPLGYYAHDASRTELHLLPLTGYGHRADGSSQLYVLWPLYRRQARSDGSHVSSLLLWLGHDATHGERRRAWLQPFVYYDRASVERSYLAVLGGALCSYERTGRERVLKLLFVPVRRWKR